VPSSLAIQATRQALIMANSISSQQKIEFLRSLFKSERPPQQKEHFTDTQEADLSQWLGEHSLAPLVYYQFKSRWPSLAQKLYPAYLAGQGQNTLFLAQIQRLNQLYSQTEHKAVLLKGAALNQEIYPISGLRNMGDIDIWVQPQHLKSSTYLLEQSKQYHFVQEPQSPYSITSLANDELKFATTTPGDRIVELHGRSFPGWWLEYAANINETAIWQRTIQSDTIAPFRLLSPEDQIIHLAVHTAIGHQFSSYVLHAYVDIGAVIQKYPLNWEKLIHLAQKQKLKTVLWIVLSHLKYFFDLDIPVDINEQLEPSRFQKKYLQKLLNADQILQLHDYRQTTQRLLILLSLTDYTGDMLRLIWGILWPNKEIFPHKPMSRFFRIRRLVHLLQTKQL